METSGGALKGLRATNTRQVLELLLNEGPVHRAELARRMKTSRTTITNIINELLERNVVLNLKPEHKTIRRGHELVSINPAAGFSLGIDFTLDKVAISASDLAGSTVGEAILTVDTAATAESRVVAAASALRGLLDEKAIEDSKIVGVGVGVPGQIDRRTDMVGGSLPGQPWSMLDVRSVFARHLPFQFFVENNSRLEGFAEKQWGAGQHSDNMLYVSFSSGVGMALFSEGELYRGSIGAAGEIGHMSTDINGATCPCGNRGCLVLRTGTAHVLALLRPALGEAAAWDDVLRETANGNPECLTVLAEIGDLTGRFLAGISNLLDPELMVIGGELAQTGEPFLGPLTAALKSHSLPLTSSHVSVAQAALPPGAATGARGGAALAIKEMAKTSTMDNLGSL
ncbi:ROK family transcriptional regulator [Arthrobacter sp. H35-D1]|uniref:ROK family transcriptional regulator n=1 Tax=Arthrobacter sp. H35-D1 TaxID=3046202 RepID=UPI0024BA2507|nr:ROK family transcriptional regulator [Arthrobacter sp. H35-D1]MDJ0315397.1 ROK family transcriptional regulator [Arthrobacter sp. H35-D1]